MTSLSDDKRPASDAELITAVRSGDDDAYAELYERHVDAARAGARSLTRSRSDVDDLVAESFARVLQAMRRGGGPDIAFRAYLLTAVRNSFYDRMRRDKRITLTDEPPDDVNEVLLSADLDSEDKKLVAAAFAGLPERWQLVLWHTEVEGRQPADVAPLLGLAPNAVAALAYRAREGLRQAYLQAHLQQTVPASCADTAPKLGAHVRDGLSTRDRRAVDQHLETCASCTALLAEVTDANRRLKGVLIPAILGVPAATYLGGLVGASAKIGGGAGVVWLWRAVRRQPKVAQGAVAAAAVAGLVAAGMMTLSLTLGGPESTSPLDPVPTAPGSAGQDDGGAGAGATPAAAGGGGPAASVPVTMTDDSAPPVPPTEGPTADPSGLTPSTPTSPTVPVATTAPSTGPPTVPPTTAPPTTTSPTTTSTTPPSTTTAPTTTAPTTTAPTTTLAPAPDLSIQSSSIGPVYRGSLAYLEVVVGNGVASRSGRSGFAARPGSVGVAIAPVVRTPVPADVAFVEAQALGWTCTSTPTEVSCTLPDLAPGAQASGILVFSLGGSVPATLSIGPSVGSGTTIVSGAPLTVQIADSPSAVAFRVAQGTVLVAGNSSMTCDLTSPQCAQAQQGGGSRLNRQDHPMTFVDVDGSGNSTFNSSSATPPLAGRRVLAARLAWGGDTADGGSSAPNPAARGSVRLTTPTGSVTIAADSVRTSGDGSTYHASADVTSIVAGAGQGVYTVAEVQAALGVGTYAGWSLTVMVEDLSLPRRALTIIDPYVSFTGGGSGAVDLPGFAPRATNRTFDVTVAAYEGELGLSPDYLDLSDVAVSNGENPSTNVFNSSVSGDRAPAHANNFGIDIDRFSGSIPPVQDVRLLASSLGEALRVGIVGLAVDL